MPGNIKFVFFKRRLPSQPILIFLGYANGNRYVGEFKDREFHGHGTLYYTNGAKWEGQFEKNRAIKGTYTFSDGLKYNENEQEWAYRLVFCKSDKSESKN